MRTLSPGEITDVILYDGHCATETAIGSLRPDWQARRVASERFFAPQWRRKGNLRTCPAFLRDDRFAKQWLSSTDVLPNRPATQTRNGTPLYFGRNSVLPAAPLLNAQGPGSSKSRLAHTALRHVCS